MSHTLRSLAIVVVATLSANAWAISAAQSNRSIASYSALAVSPGTAGSSTFTLELDITRWSTPAEQNTLVTTLLEAPATIVDVLKKMPSTGRLSSPGAVGYDLRYASQATADGMQRVLLMTDRPVGFWEAALRDRTLDYPITIIELRVPEKGTGEGKVAVAARLGVNRFNKQPTYEDFSYIPVSLQGVQRH